MYLFEECRRLLRQSHTQLIVAPSFSDDSFRPVDVLALEATRGLNPQPDVLPHLHDNAAEPADSSSNSQQSEAHEESCNDVSSQGSCAAAGDDTDVLQVPLDVKVEAFSDDEHVEETVDISALSHTTSAHDDWLHRGPFLYDLDFHTYVEYVHREPRAKNARAKDSERHQDLFLFDAHYSLAESYVQALDTQGQCKVVVLEALKCPSPAANAGEDNAVFKSLIGTLLRCPGQGHCSDPLLCNPGFFQVSRPSTTSIAPKFNCRPQWKARRAEIETLANKAEMASDQAKRIPVIADTTTLRTFRIPGGPSDTLWIPVGCLLLCLTQLWIQKFSRGYPPWARCVLEFCGCPMHHPSQISLAEFAAYRLREKLFNLDMLTIARTTKISAEQPAEMAAENETMEEHPEPRKEMETEMHGGQVDEQDEPEDEDLDSVQNAPRHVFDTDVLNRILTRENEIMAAKQKGRTKYADKQMKLFDDLFHETLHAPVRPNNVKLHDVHMAYSQPDALTTALCVQDEILKQMRSNQASPPLLNAE